jgi:transposase
MGRERTPGKPTTRRYTDDEKAQAVRLVRALRAETGQRHGAVRRVAEQLGYGVESVRSWVNQADVDEGTRAGTTTEDAARLKALEQENRELRRANEILRRASAQTGTGGLSAHGTSAAGPPGANQGQRQEVRHPRDHDL